MTLEKNNLVRGIKAAERALKILVSKRETLTPEQQECLDALIASIKTTKIPLQILLQ